MILLILLYLLAIFYLIKFVKKIIINSKISIDYKEFTYKRNPLTETEKNLYNI